MRYRRSIAPAATRVFTVNGADRTDDRLVRSIDALREVAQQVKATHPFEIVAMVVLREHLHAIWHWPAGDAAYLCLRTRFTCWFFLRGCPPLWAHPPEWLPLEC